MASVGATRAMGGRLEGVKDPSGGLSRDAGLAAGRITARLDRLPSTRTVWSMIGLLSLGFFFELYDLLFTGYVAPGLVRSGILTSTTPGLFGSSGVASFVAALFAGLFVGTVGCGFLADRFGRRSIFTYSLLWYTAANVVMALQTTALGLNVWRFVAGIGLGLEMVTIGTYLSELAPKRLRGRAFACCQAIGFTAVPVVAALSYLLVPTAPFGVDGWRWVVLIGAVAAIGVWWIRLVLPESPRWLAQRGRIAEAEHVMTTLERRVAAEYGRPLPTPEAPEPVVPYGRFADMWVPPYRYRTIMMAGFNIFQTVGFYGFANWVPTLLIKQGITVTNSLLYTAIIALAAPVGPLLGLAIADRYERKHVIVAAALAVLVLGLLFSQSVPRGRDRRAGYRPDPRQQHHVLQFPRLPERAVPDRHPGARGRVRLFVEPLLGHLHGFPHRLYTGPVRHHGRLRVHRGRHAGRGLADRVHGTAHPQPGARDDLALTSNPVESRP